jgi:hypothetical protein
MNLAYLLIPSTLGTQTWQARVCQKGLPHEASNGTFLALASLSKGEQYFGKYYIRDQVVTQFSVASQNIIARSLIGVGWRRSEKKGPF